MRYDSLINQSVLKKIVESKVSQFQHRALLQFSRKIKKKERYSGAEICRMIRLELLNYSKEEAGDKMLKVESD